MGSGMGDAVILRMKAVKGSLSEQCRVTNNSSLQ